MKKSFRNPLSTPTNRWVAAATTAAVLSGMFGACAEGPRQYDRGAPPRMGVAGAPLVTEIDIPLPAIDQDARDEDAIARENSLKPIVYGKGAAGITFETTLEQAKTALSKPFFGPRPSDGLTAYNEGVYVFWDLEKKKPSAFLINSDYQGSLTLPSPIGPLKAGADLSSHFSDADPRGEKLLAAAYNALEGVQDASYSCLSDRQCEVQDAGENFILSWSKLALLVSKDRKVLFRLMLLDATPQGKLDNNLDILTGTFHVPAQEGVEGSVAETITMGETWAQVNGKLRIDGNTSVGTSSFGKSFDGIYLGLTKGTFERTYREPRPEEKVNVVSVYGGFKRAIRLGDSFVKIDSLDTDKVTLTTVSEITAAADAEDPLAGYLRVKVQLDKARLEDFAKKLADLIAASLKGRNANLEVRTQLSGLHRTAGPKELVASVIAWDKVEHKGVAIEFKVSEESGNIDWIQHVVLDSPVDLRTVPGLAVSATAGDSLMGFKLGETVTVSDVDLGRDEATVALTAPDAKVRATYSPDGLLTGVFDAGVLESHEVAVVKVGSVGVTLGLTRTGKITSISTGALSGISGICGSLLSVGDRDRDVKRMLDSTHGCQYRVEEDPDATGLIRAIHFPAQGIRISFADRELSTVTLYRNPREVQ